MNKATFLSILRSRLQGLPWQDVERSLEYYSEIIDDRMEDGMTEEEAVAAMGSIDEIVNQILMATPLPKLVKERVRPRRPWRAWEIILLILGSPVWLPLLLAAVAVFLACYVVLWAIIVVMYAVDLAVAVSAVAGLWGGGMLFAAGFPAQGMMTLGGVLLCAGVAILLFFAFNQIAKGILKLSKKLILSLKSIFVRKGAMG